MPNCFSKYLYDLYFHLPWINKYVEPCSFLHIVTLDFKHFCQSNSCNMFSHRGFGLLYSDDEWCHTSFHIFINHLCFLSCKMSISFASFLGCYLVASVSLIDLREFFIYFCSPGFNLNYYIFHCFVIFDDLLNLTSILYIYFFICNIW